MKLLKDLVDCNLDLKIDGVTDDSRLVKENYLFIATNGFFTDHSEFVKDAISRGCVAVVSQKEMDIDVPVILSDDVNAEYVKICQKFFDVSPDDFSFIGVTGTDGKTTTTSIIRQLLNDSNKCGLIGTNGIYVDNDFMGTSNTTPCTYELYKGLNMLKSHNCECITMEVSSEALLHDRVSEIKYNIVGYTNITEDHLNIHKTIDNYINCKAKLLKLLKEDGVAVINGDDKYCKSLKCKNMYTYGFNNDNDYVINDVNYLENSVEFCIVSPCGKYKLVSPLVEKYNIYNVTLAFIICLLYGVDADYLISKVKEIKNAPGRGEHLHFGQDYEIVLDYAHTYNGIDNLLDSVRNYKKIITVTGCAGGREKEKRAKIGKLIMEKSDVSVFTMDDPRNESVDDIIDDMVGDSTNYVRIVDRPSAIKYAFSIADSSTIVLIIGKGRDNYMAIGSEKLPYNDYDVIKSCFE